MEENAKLFANLSAIFSIFDFFIHFE